MTSPIKPISPNHHLILDPAEIFAEKTQVIIKIKRLMIERSISNADAARLTLLEERDFQKMLIGDYSNYPLSYLKTLHKRIMDTYLK